MPGPSESTHENVAAELDAIAASIGEGVQAEALDRRMRLAHDAVLALGREANQERAVSIALLVAALRAGAPPHPGMARQLRDVATELRETAARGPA